MSEPKGVCPSCGVYLHLEHKPTPKDTQDMKQIYLWVGIIGVVIGIIGIGRIGTENGSFCLFLPLGILFLVGAFKTSK
jgi:hypothetical protein